MKRPIEVLDSAIGAGILRGSRGPVGKPGEIIARMTEEARAQLGKLTSSDVADVRSDLVYDDEETAARKRYSAMLIEADRLRTIRRR